MFSIKAVNIKPLSCGLGLLGMLCFALNKAGLIPLEIMSFIAVGLSFYLAVSSRSNRLIFLIYGILAYAVYSIGLANYYNKIDSLYTTLLYTAYAETGIATLVLFLSILVFLFPNCINKYGRGNNVFRRKETNIIFVTIIAVILILVMVYGFGRPDSLGDERGKPSVLYEYSIILFIAAFYFSGKSCSANIVLSIILALFALQNLMYGGRVTALQLIFVWFFFFYSEKMSTLPLSISIAVGLMLFTVVGNLRTGFLSSSISQIFQSLISSVSSGLAWDTAYSSWHTSLTFYAFKDLCSAKEVCFLLGQWLISIILGGSAVPAANLPALTQSVIFHQFGGILPIYFDFYLGVLGVILIGCYVGFLIRRINNTSLEHYSRENGIARQALKLSCLYITVTAPRWLLYSPSQITRGLILCLLACGVLLWIEQSMRGIRKKR